MVSLPLRLLKKDTPVGMGASFLLSWMLESFRLLNCEFVDHPQSEMGRAGGRVCNEADQRPIASTEINGKRASPTSCYRLETAKSLPWRRTGRCSWLKGAQKSSTVVPGFKMIGNASWSCSP